MYRAVVVIILVAVIAGIAGALYLRHKPGPQTPVSALTITFFDSALGNGILVQSPDGNTTLIDPGPDNTARALVDYLKTSGVDSLSILASAPSARRSGAIKAVCEQMSVTSLFRGELTGSSRAWKAAIKTVRDAGIKEVVLSQADSVELGDAVMLAVLSPPKGLIDGTAHDYDNNSLVTRLRFHETSVLLTSDARTPVEGLLIQSNDQLATDVLVVGRNGRPEATSLELLSHVRPEVCIVLAGTGPNRPSSAVLERIDTPNTGAAVYRTDEDGILHMVTDGHSIVVRTESTDRG